MTKPRRTFARRRIPALCMAVAAAAARDAFASGCRRAALGVLTALWVLGLAAPAQAGTRMYTGSLIIHAFGNDTTTGAPPPYFYLTYFGIPLTGQCNVGQYHAKETLMFPTTEKSPPTQSFTFTIPTYGGQVPNIDTNGDTVPDIVEGCGRAPRTTRAASRSLCGR